MSYWLLVYCSGLAINPSAAVFCAQACRLIEDLRREKGRQDETIDGAVVKKALVGLSDLCKSGMACTCLDKC